MASGILDDRFVDHIDVGKIDGALQPIAFPICGLFGALFCLLGKIVHRNLRMCPSDYRSSAPSGQVRPFVFTFVALVLLLAETAAARRRQTWRLARA